MPLYALVTISLHCNLTSIQSLKRVEYPPGTLHHHNTRGRRLFKPNGHFCGCHRLKINSRITEPCQFFPPLRCWVFSQLLRMTFRWPLFYSLDPDLCMDPFPDSLTTLFGLIHAEMFVYDPGYCVLLTFVNPCSTPYISIFRPRYFFEPTLCG